jgi:hypothetical protein
VTIPEGFVSIAFAEEKWAEREAVFELHCSQMQALLGSQTDTASEVSPSEAGDLDSADPLDDGAWCKVDRAKRQKILLRDKENLSRNVRSRLEKVSKTNSPFAKA